MLLNSLSLTLGITLALIALVTTAPTAPPAPPCPPTQQCGVVWGG